MPEWIQSPDAVPPDFNGPVDLAFQRFEESWIEEPVFPRFQQLARQHPDRIALTDGVRQLDYASLLQKCIALATGIARRASSGPVGLILGQHLEFPLAALACLAAGRAYIPIDPAYPAARITSIVEDGGVQLVVTMKDLPADCLPRGTDVLRLDQFDFAGQADNSLAVVPADVDQPAVILYTSGSTGKPKGICNNQGALLQRVCEATNASHIRSDDQMLLLSSPGTIAGEREMFAALLNGATLNLCDPQHDGLHQILNVMRERRITLCYIVPALFRMLFRAPGAAAALASLRVLRIGGDITLASDLRLFREVAPAGCHLLASFSATEMPAVFQWFVPQHWQADSIRLPVGYARPETAFQVLDDDGNPVAPGAFGELVVKSRYLALGHWQQGRLIPGPIETDDADPSLRILRSGDMVRQRADGLWELTGRKDRQIKIHGQRIDTGEVEAVLRSHAEVQDAVVLTRKQGDEAVALVGFVAAPGTDRNLLEDLRVLLAERLPRFMRPAQLHRLASIPQLPGFKPDMQALQKLDEQFLQARKAQPASPAAARANLLEDDASSIAVREAVSHAWGRVLGAQSYAQDLPFDVSGGDSLKALELWFHIEESLGFKLALDAMSSESRPSELQEALVAQLRVSHAEQPASMQDDKPLIYLVPGILGDDPLQLRFRGAFGDSVRFKLIDYPGWRDTMASGCSFEAIIDAAFRQVCADPPQASYRLAGYSYGGIVAFELARRLVSAGRKVDMVALLDSRRWDVAQTRPIWQQDEMLPENGPVSRMLAAGITLLVRLRAWPLLSFTCVQLTRHAHRLAFRFRNRMTKDLRFEALRKWRARYLDVPVTLFVSASRWPGEPEGYGWQHMAARLDVVHVGGTHATMIDKPGRETIADYMRRALACWSSGRETA